MNRSTYHLTLSIFFFIIQVSSTIVSIQKSQISNEITVIQTARDTSDRLTPQASIVFGDDFPANTPTFTVSHGTTNNKQQIIGFGGAFTEASAVNFAALAPTQQEQLLQAYFGPEGIGYTIGRIPINSCDFSVATYSFDEVIDDFNLTFFDHSLAHDHETMIPFIHAAKQANVNREIKFFGTPWSPPSWFKIPHPGQQGQGMNGSATPLGLRPEPAYHDAWARYISLWIDAYKNSEIPIWGITIQNEPQALQVFESCLYTPEAQRDFLRDYLGPTIRQHHPEVNIMIWDHNKYNYSDGNVNMTNWAQVIMSDRVAASYVDGMAYHWYQIFEQGQGFGFDVLQATRQVLNEYSSPRTFLMHTEGCVCPPTLPPDWSNGELYGTDLLGDLNAWSVGYVDWNLILDEQGGPNHVHNYCEAPVLRLSQRDSVSNSTNNNNSSNNNNNNNNDKDDDNMNDSKLIFMTQFYYMGQVSKYIIPDSYIITSQLQDAAAHNTWWVNTTVNVTAGNVAVPVFSGAAADRPDDQTVVVLMNTSDQPIQLKLRDVSANPTQPKIRAVNITIPAHSIQTYIYATWLD